MTKTVVMITGPAAEPVSLDEAKAQVRVLGTDEDTLLGLLISAARHEAEGLTRRQMMPATLELVLDGFPGRNAPIVLPWPPLQSVTSVTYVDTDGATQTMVANTDYTVDTDSQPGRVLPAYDTDWPETRDQHGAVRVRYVAGYVDADAVPSPIKVWMLVRIASLFEQREDFLIGTVTPMPHQFTDSLLDGFVVPGAAL